jgi:16S rRNA (guanine527-N7)-methyltransferase
MAWIANVLPADAPELFRQYRNLLLSWNNRFNLTAITEPEEVDRRLIGDALRMLPAIDDAIEAWKTGERRRTTEEPGAPGPRLIDIGSGAGFPGMVLKIARPELDVTLLESTGKKVGFLDHVIVELGLQHARAIQSRAEDAGRLPHHRERYDIVTARAVAALPVLMELCIPFLRIGGHAIFPKGESIDEELEHGKKAAKLVGARIVACDALPATDGDVVTQLVTAVKIELTPARYPRRPGVPNRDPLGRADQ